MQYFADNEIAFQIKLLFYLVTRVFAQPLSPFESDDICDRVKKGLVRGRTRPDVIRGDPTSAV